MTAALPPRRWDPVVKLTHWSIVLAVLANAIFTEEGSGTHVWVGYGLAAILALRLFWGLIGPAEARFASFLPSPRKAVAHIRDIREGRDTPHVSHNPLGALMVYAIWSCLIVIIVSGIAMAGLPGSGSGEGGERTAPAPTGVALQPRAGEEAEADEAEAGEERGEDGDDSALGEVHEVAANLLYILILLHIAGVVFETRRSGRQVVLAMLPGSR